MISQLRLLINSLLISFTFSFHSQVWFQNRRMKDKRQRIAVAWPYAAVYSDPAFAASILQAAANSVGLPYGYSPSPILPPVMPAQLPSANHFSSYGYAAAAAARYAPYPIPPRASQLSTQNAASYPSMLNSMSQSYAPALHIPKTHTPPHDLQSPGSPHSTSLSPGSDKMAPSPIKSHHSQQGLLMTASSSPTHHSSLSAADKPKLFKPYKSES